MKKIKYLLLAVATVFTFTSCDEDAATTLVNANFVDFESEAYRLGVDPGSSSTQMINFYSANVSDTDRTFNLTVAGSTTAPSGSYNVPATVTIPAGTNAGVIPVEVLGVSGLDCFNDVVVNFTPTDGLSSGGATTVTFFENPTAGAGGATSNIRILIAPDSYPEETSWEITDLLGNVVASGGPYGGITSTTAVDFTLPANACYNLTFFDSWGDGMADGSGFGLEVDGVRVIAFAVRTNWDSSITLPFSTK